MTSVILVRVWEGVICYTNDMKKLIPILAILLLIGLGLCFFTRETHHESVEMPSMLCDNGTPNCHGDGVRRYKTMTLLSTFGAVLAGASGVGLAVVVGNQAMKRPKRKK